MLFAFTFCKKFESRLKFHLPNPFQEEDEVVISVFECGATTLTLCLYRHCKIVLWNPSTDENVAPSRSMEAIPSSWGSLITLHGSGYDHARHNYMTIRPICFFRLNNQALLRRNLSRGKISNGMKYLITLYGRFIM